MGRKGKKKVLALILLGSFFTGFPVILWDAASYKPASQDVAVPLWTRAMFQIEHILHIISHICGVLLLEKKLGQYRNETKSPSYKITVIKMLRVIG